MKKLYLLHTEKTCAKSMFVVKYDKLSIFTLKLFDKLKIKVILSSLEN